MASAIRIGTRVCPSYGTNPGPRGTVINTGSHRHTKERMLNVSWDDGESASWCREVELLVLNEVH